MKTEADSTVKFFIVVIGVVVIALVLKELSNIFIPLVIAYFLFFVFSPLNNFLEKRKVPLPVLIILDLILILFAGWIISAFLIESFKQFGMELPFYAEKLNRIVSSWAISLGVTDPFYTNFSIEEVISGIDYENLVGGIFTSTFSVLGNILFIVFFFVFVISGHKNIYEAIRKRFLTKRIKPLLNENDDLNTAAEDDIHVKEERVVETFQKITSQIQKYLISKFLINLAAGFAAFIILSLFGIDFPVIWGTSIFLFNFIPTIGSAFALILPVLMTLVQFESTSFALLILIVIIILQSVFFNVIEPAVIGRRLNLNPLLILIAVLIWGYIWGIVGMLLAIPLTAIIKIVISNSDSKNLSLFTDIMSHE